MSTLSFLFTVPMIAAWGGDGHAIVTQVAINIVSDKGSRFVENLIGEDYAVASRWPDSTEASERYPDSDDYHFSHTPYQNCQPFDLVRDCGFPGKEGLCIVTGLAESIQMVVNPDSPRDERADALKFVLHFMADIHQPLHTGFREDAGGTLINIANSPNTTLHSLWDYGIIENHLKGESWHKLSDSILRSVNMNDRKFVQRIANQSNLSFEIINGTAKSIVEYISMIATDTTMTATCKIAYTTNGISYIQNKDFVSEEYLRRGMVAVQVQLSKAAVRLALLIDVMADVYALRVAERKEVRRAIRIEKLFDRMKQESAEKAERVHDPLEGNRFEVLAIDFDMDAYLYEPGDEMVVGSSCPSSPTVRLSKQERKAKIASLKAQEARRLELQSRQEAKKKTRIVDGIDLNSLVLIKRNGHYYITNLSFVTSKLFFPKRSIVVFIKFANQTESDKPIGFLLDNNIFHSVPSTGFLTQVFKAIKGEDALEGEKFDSPVSSVETLAVDKPLDPIATAYFETGKLGKSEAEFMDEFETDLESARDAYRKRFKSMEERLRYESEIDQKSVTQLKKHMDDLVVVFLPGAIFVSTYGFCKNNMEFTFNKFSAINSKVSLEKDFYILIDTRLFDEDLSDGPLALIRRAVITPKVKTRTAALTRNFPVFFDRMVKLILATGFGHGETNILDLIYFKKFELVKRVEKPLLTTFSVDLTFDPSRSSVAKYMLSSVISTATPTTRRPSD